MRGLQPSPRLRILLLLSLLIGTCVSSENEHVEPAYRDDEELAGNGAAIEDVERSLQRIDPVYRDQCLLPILAADLDLDGKMSASEYLGFAILLGLPTTINPMMVASSLQLPLNLQTEYIFLSCLCDNNSDADPDCCTGANAHISVTQAEDDDIYLHYVCFLTNLIVQESLAPTTEVPGTSAPVVSVPVTSAPATFAPVIPNTAAPVPSTPVTLAPVVSVPVTLAPVTSGPEVAPTAGPSTLAPAVATMAPVVGPSTPSPVMQMTMAPTVDPTSAPVAPANIELDLTLLIGLREATGSSSNSLSDYRDDILQALNELQFTGTPNNRRKRQLMLRGLQDATSGNDAELSGDSIVRCPSIVLEDVVECREVEVSLTLPKLEDIKAQLKKVVESGDLQEKIEAINPDSRVLVVGVVEEEVEATNPPIPAPWPKEEDDTFPPGILAGLVVFGVVLLVVGAAFIFYRKWRTKQEKDDGSALARELRASRRHSGQSSQYSADSQYSAATSTHSEGPDDMYFYEEANSFKSFRVNEDDYEKAYKSYQAKLAQSIMINTDTTSEGLYTDIESTPSPSSPYSDSSSGEKSNLKQAPVAPGDGYGYEDPIMSAFATGKNGSATSSDPPSPAPNKLAIGLGAGAAGAAAALGAVALRNRDASDDSSSADDSVTRDMENQFLDGGSNFDSSESYSETNEWVDQTDAAQFHARPNSSQVGAALALANKGHNAIPDGSSTDTSSEEEPTSDDTSTSSSSSSSSSSTENTCTGITNYDPKTAEVAIASATLAGAIVVTTASDDEMLDDMSYDASTGNAVGSIEEAEAEAMYSRSKHKNAPMDDTDESQSSLLDDAISLGGMPSEMVESSSDEYTSGDDSSNDRRIRMSVVPRSKAEDDRESFSVDSASEPNRSFPRTKDDDVNIEMPDEYEEALAPTPSGGAHAASDKEESRISSTDDSMGSSGWSSGTTSNSEEDPNHSSYKIVAERSREAEARSSNAISSGDTPSDNNSLAIGLGAAGAVIVGGAAAAIALTKKESDEEEADYDSSGSSHESSHFDEPDFEAVIKPPCPRQDSLSDFNNRKLEEAVPGQKGTSPTIIMSDDCMNLSPIPIPGDDSLSDMQNNRRIGGGGGVGVEQSLMSNGSQPRSLERLDEQVKLTASDLSGTEEEPSEERRGASVAEGMMRMSVVRRQSRIASRAQQPQTYDRNDLRASMPPPVVDDDGLNLQHIVQGTSVLERIAASSDEDDDSSYFGSDDDSASSSISDPIGGKPSLRVNNNPGDIEDNIWGTIADAAGVESDGAEQWAMVQSIGALLKADMQGDLALLPGVMYESDSTDSDGKFPEISDDDSSTLSESAKLVSEISADE